MPRRESDDSRKPMPYCGYTIQPRRGGFPLIFNPNGSLLGNAQSIENAKSIIRNEIAKAKAGASSASKPAQ